MGSGKNGGLEVHAGQFCLEDILQVNIANIENHEEKLRIDLLMNSTNLLNEETFIQQTLQVQKNKLTQVQLKQINLVKTITTAIYSQLVEMMKELEKIAEDKREKLLKEINEFDPPLLQQF